jgi:hypothetical protein
MQTSTKFCSLPPTHHYGLPLGLGKLVYFFSCELLAVYIVCREVRAGTGVLGCTVFNCKRHPSCD